jgi:hypothetical protein
MKRFGFVRVGLDDAGTYKVKPYSGASNGTVYHSGSSVEDVQFHNTPPACVWYEEASSRDLEMLAAAQKFPGVMFSPVEVTAGVKNPPSPKVVRYDLSDKGVLPA